MMPTPPGINSGVVVDQLAYLSSMAYKIGQMGVVRSVPHFLSYTFPTYISPYVSLFLEIYIFIIQI